MRDLGLHGMAKGFRDRAENPERQALGHAERLGIPPERESTRRQQKRFESRAKSAKRRRLAAVSAKSAGLARGRRPPHAARARRFAQQRRLDRAACREALPAPDQRVPRLFAALALARGDGRCAKLLKPLARVDLLILDDWGPEPLRPEPQRDLLEIVEDRYDAGSLIITSQAPIDRWHESVGNPTLADAILDRIAHNAHRIEFRGESLRKRRVAG